MTEGVDGDQDSIPSTRRHRSRGIVRFLHGSKFLGRHCCKGLEAPCTPERPPEPESAAAQTAREVHVSKLNTIETQLKVFKSAQAMAQPGEVAQAAA